MAVPRGPAVRSVAARHGGRDHPRAAVRAAAPGAALQPDGRDRGLGGLGGRRRGADRSDDLRAARQPEGDRARQGRAARSRRSARPRAPSSSGCSAAGCTCSCSSRCGRSGSRIPSATRRWGWSSPAERCCGPDEGVLLAVRRHGESGAIVSVFTARHGRHAGLVRGGFGRRARPVYQPGNVLQVTWRARLAEQLGSFARRAQVPLAARLLLDPAAPGRARRGLRPARDHAARARSAP